MARRAMPLAQGNDLPERGIWGALSSDRQFGGMATTGQAGWASILTTMQIDLASPVSLWLAVCCAARI